MKVEVLPNGKHVISDGDDRIELTQVSYEDIFYAIPIDNGSLFMLLNDTVLETADARATLKRIVERKGGIEPAMTELQEVVKEVQPGGAAPGPPPPEPEEEEEEKTIVLPNLKGIAPAAPSRPMTPTPKTPTPPTSAPPAKPTHPTPAAARPSSPSPSALPPMEPLKKTEHPKPAEPAKEPAAVAPSVNLKSFGPDGKPVVKVAKLAADQFAIAYGALAVTLTRMQYEKLHKMCPAQTSTLFHTLMSQVLSGTEKATFRKIVAAAGHSKPILDAINEQVQKLHPGAAVRK